MQTVSEAAIPYNLSTKPNALFSNRKGRYGKDHSFKIIATTHKNTVVVAPTGIAALNAGGVTIHSMFQLPFGGFIPAFGVDSQFTDTV
jgi:hypothetical protein